MMMIVLMLLVLLVMIMIMSSAKVVDSLIFTGYQFATSDAVCSCSSVIGSVIYMETHSSQNTWLHL